MTKINKIVSYLIFFLFLHSCGGVSDAGKVLRNEKSRTTDEFLIKKREPLVLPPNYENLPTPGSYETKQENENNKIKSILKIPKENSNVGKSSKSVEQSIINSI